MTNWVERRSKKQATELEAYPALVQRLLLNRDIATREQAEQFLHPDYTRDSVDPYLIQDMAKAVERIVLAISKREKIVIFGDYDADGIPGATTLYLLFRALDYPLASVYIPDRYSEKYGLSDQSLRKFHADGATVVITVDCGITDVDEAIVARELGIDLIITDHHIVPITIPTAYAVLNIKRPDDTSPFKHYCGAGMAWKLAQGIIRHKKVNSGINGLELEKSLLDLVAISTICDMVPLVGENRVIVREGLLRMARHTRVGLKALFAKAKLKPLHITEDDIAFMVGPRINISSRMAHGSDTFYLLSTDDALLANSIATELEVRNKVRRGSVQVIMDSVTELLDIKTLPEMIVVGDNAWRIGVLGLTANRLMEKYSRPVCVWTLNHEGHIKGSIRSDGSVLVNELFSALGGDDFFINHGGHELAGGFSLTATLKDEFEQRLALEYQKLRKAPTLSKLKYDTELKVSDIGWKLYGEIESLAPFGKGNDKPIFLIKNVSILSVTEFGKDHVHAELLLGDEGRQIPMIAFFKSLQDFSHLDLATGQNVDVLVNIEKSVFKGYPELRLRLVDIRQTT